MGFVFVTNEVACNYFALAQYSLVTPQNKATVWCTCSTGRKQNATNVHVCNFVVSGAFCLSMFVFFFF